MATKEIWKPVIGFEGLYEVSNLGRVKSLPRNTTSGGIMVSCVHPKNGYCYVTLSKNGKGISRRVHKLVYEAFTGDVCDGYDPLREINHKDGDKTNNRLENLERVTATENLRHASRMGLMNTSGREVICLDNMQVFESLTAAAHFAGSNSRNGGNLVARVCRGERSHYRGLHFAFYADYLNGTIPAYRGDKIKRPTTCLWR